MSIITNLRSIYESNEIFENSYYTPIMELEGDIFVLIRIIRIIRIKLY